MDYYPVKECGQIDNPRKCSCRCHIQKGIRHAAACCCPHRYKVRMECPDCATLYERMVADMCREIPS